MIAGRPVCQARQQMARCRAMSTDCVPARAGCQHAGTKGTHDDGNRRRQNPRHWSRSRCRVPRTRCRWRASTSGPHWATTTSATTPRTSRRSPPNSSATRSRTRAPGHSVSNCCAWRLRSGRGHGHRPLPVPPVKRSPAPEHGRGLHVVEALSARWGWTPQDPGKAVFAILTREA